MENETAQLRKQLVQNKELATEISEVLAKYRLDIPKGKTVVWGPVVMDLPETLWEAYGILVNGIPAPDLLKAALLFKEQNKLVR
jgi:hypothetical protein